MQAFVDFFEPLLFQKVSIKTCNLCKTGSKRKTRKYARKKVRHGQKSYVSLHHVQGTFIAVSELQKKTKQKKSTTGGHIKQKIYRSKTQKKKDKFENCLRVVGVKIILIKKLTLEV